MDGMWHSISKHPSVTHILISSASPCSTAHAIKKKLQSHCFWISSCQQADHTELDANHQVNLAPVSKVLINPQLVLCYYNALLNAVHGSDPILCKVTTHWRWRWDGCQPQEASGAIFVPHDKKTSVGETHGQSHLPEHQTFRRFQSHSLLMCACIFNQSMPCCSIQNTHFLPTDPDTTPSTTGTALSWSRGMSYRDPHRDALRKPRTPS